MTRRPQITLTGTARERGIERGEAVADGRRRNVAAYFGNVFDRRDADERLAAAERVRTDATVFLDPAGRTMRATRGPPCEASYESDRPGVGA